MKCLFAIVCCALLANAAPAALLPPVDPILPGTDHAQEDHSGHDDRQLYINGDLTGASFSGANLDGSALEFGINLTSASFHNASIVGGTFGGDLSHADFSGAVLHNLFIQQGAHGIGVNFVGTDFRSSIWDEPVFDNSDFRGARFGGLHMDEPRISNSTMRGAIFHDDVFGNADFSGLILENVDLRDADFRGVLVSFRIVGSVDMRGDDLRGASFHPGYEELTRAVFDATTIYDRQTVFPTNFDPVARGLTLVPEPTSCLLAVIGAVVLVAGRRFRR